MDYFIIYRCTNAIWEALIIKASRNCAMRDCEIVHQIVYLESRHSGMYLFGNKIENRRVYDTCASYSLNLLRSFY